MANLRWRHVFIWCAVAFVIQLCLCAAILLLASRKLPNWMMSGTGMEATRFGFSWMVWNRHAPTAPASIQWSALPQEIVAAATVEIGWPMPAVHRTTLHKLDLDPEPNLIVIHISYTLPETLLENISLYRMHYAGLFCNALLFASCLMGAHLLVLTLVQRSGRWRRARGLCPKCACDLRGTASQRCPECGASS